MRVSAGMGMRNRRVYVVNKRRFVPFLIILVLIMALCVLLYLNLTFFTGEYTADDFLSDHLLMYFEVEMDLGVPWYYLAAIDKVEAIPEQEISKGRSAGIALHLTGIEGDDELPLFLQSYRGEKTFARAVVNEIKRFAGLQEIFLHKGFPLGTADAYHYQDGYGDARSYGGSRKHEGIDLMADMGVPIRSVGDGTVEQVGWNEYGGWRIGIRGRDGIYYYYAHMSRYEGRPQKGDKVKRGQTIGYVGDSGYGPEGTTGQFAPHLHFGMYRGRGSGLKAFNPYPFLRAWEAYSR